MPKKTKSASKQTEEVKELAAPTASVPAEKPPRRAPAKAKKATTGKNGTKKPRSKAPAKGTKSRGPTDEDIRIRAYFISERRHRLGLAGDATSDWEEARRQLLSEAAAR